MHVNGDVDLFDGLVLVNDAHATGSSGAIHVKGKVQLQPRWGRGTKSWVSRWIIGIFFYKPYIKLQTCTAKQHDMDLQCFFVWVFEERLVERVLI